MVYWSELLEFTAKKTSAAIFCALFVSNLDNLDVSKSSGFFCCNSRAECIR